jgi:hypothetical protein
LDNGSRDHLVVRALHQKRGTVAVNIQANYIDVSEPDVVASSHLLIDKVVDALTAMNLGSLPRGATEPSLI